MINSSQFFDWLVRHHSTVNLGKCLPHIEGGRIHQDGSPLQEGIDENKLYKGTLIVADGEGLIQRLERDRMAWGVGTNYTPIRDAGDLSSYLEAIENPDGGHVYDSVGGLMTGVKHFREPANLPQDFDPYDNDFLRSVLPGDFSSSNGSRIEVGNRGLVGLAVPLGYPQAHVLQIKQTAYGNLGMGKVVHFSTNGLVEEFFFTSREDSLQNTLDPINSVQGVYRRYAREGAGLVRIAEEVRALPAVYDPLLL
ncbi:hypothetical protein HY500_04610 [Candidatus Woesearchaeota archaeon]|nr:hypothetical protein [Candidatus Woesearchaeota archaeon]